MTTQANEHQRNLVDKLREKCCGTPPLNAILSPWLVDLMAKPGAADEIRTHFENYGSPLNIHSTTPFRQNIKAYRQLGDQLELDFEVYFARKANKCLTYVDACRELGCGVDTASAEELRQALAAGIAADKLICTAAIKSQQLLDLCLSEGVVIALDNADEWFQLKKRVQVKNQTGKVALRLSRFVHQNQRLNSRFGFDLRQVRQFVSEHFTDPSQIRIVGLHFHLDGYEAGQRASALNQCFDEVEWLRQQGHRIEFVDMGGGFPISYLDSQVQWNQFWEEHTASLQGRQSPITYRNHGLGKLVTGGEVHGQAELYPYYQSTTDVTWLGEVLNASFACITIAERCRNLKVQLRCEPGRALLNGCGATIARVAFCKQHQERERFIGLEMNRTQCRTGSVDFLVDPVILHSDNQQDAERSTGSFDGYLVGAYCTESELLTWRRLRFPHGITAGDYVVFPNTAGYFMHFYECRSHQFPLAKNLVVSDGDFAGAGLDAIDAMD